MLDHISRPFLPRFLHMIYGVTGIHKGYVPDKHDHIVRYVLSRVPEPKGFVTGAAYGVDTSACEIAYELYPNLQHTIVVPDAWHNVDLVEMYGKKPNVTVMRMEPGTDYRRRNYRLVQLSERVIAFPLVRLEIPRSGTWMTSNIARRANKLWKVEILS